MRRISGARWPRKSFDFFKKKKKGGILEKRFSTSGVDGTVNVVEAMDL